MNRIARQSEGLNVSRNQRWVSPAQKWTIIIGTVLLFGMATALLWLIRDCRSSVNKPQITDVLENNKKPNPSKFPDMSVLEELPKSDHIKLPATSFDEEETNQEVDESEDRSVGDFFRRAAKMSPLPINDFDRPEDIAIEKFVCPGGEFWGDVRLFFKGKPLGFVNIGTRRDGDSAAVNAFQDKYQYIIRDKEERIVGFRGNLGSYDFTYPNGQGSSFRVGTTPSDESSEGMDDIVYKGDFLFPFGWTSYDRQYVDSGGGVLAKDKEDSQAFLVYDKPSCGNPVKKRRASNAIKFSGSEEEDSTAVVRRFERGIAFEAMRLGLWREPLSGTSSYEK